MNSENHLPFSQNSYLHQDHLSESSLTSDHTNLSPSMAEKVPAEGTKEQAHQKAAAVALKALSRDPGLGDFIIFAKSRGFSDQQIFETFRTTHSVMFDHAPNGAVDRAALKSAGLRHQSEREWLISRLGGTANEGTLSISELWGLLLMNTLELKTDDKGSTLALTNRGVKAFESFANTDLLDALLNNDVVGSFIVYARSLGYSDDHIYATYQSTYALIGDHAPSGYLDHPELIAAGLADAEHRKWLMSHLIGEMDYPQLTLIDIWDAQLIGVIDITRQCDGSQLALTEEALHQYNFERNFSNIHDIENSSDIDEPPLAIEGPCDITQQSESKSEDRSKPKHERKSAQSSVPTNLLTYELEMGVLSIDTTSGSITFHRQDKR